MGTKQRVQGERSWHGAHQTCREQQGKALLEGSHDSISPDLRIYTPRTQGSSLWLWALKKGRAAWSPPETGRGPSSEYTKGPTQFPDSPELPFQCPTSWLHVSLVLCQDTCTEGNEHRDRLRGTHRRTHRQAQDRHTDTDGLREDSGRYTHIPAPMISTHIPTQVLAHMAQYHTIITYVHHPCPSTTPTPSPTPWPTAALRKPPHPQPPSMPTATSIFV